MGRGETGEQVLLFVRLSELVYVIDQHVGGPGCFGKSQRNV